MDHIPLARERLVSNRPLAGRNTLPAPASPAWRLVAFQSCTTPPRFRIEREESSGRLTLLLAFWGRFPCTWRTSPRVPAAAPDTGRGAVAPRSRFQSRDPECADPPLLTPGRPAGSIHMSCEVPVVRTGCGSHNPRTPCPGGPAGSSRRASRRTARTCRWA